ncbi:MAG: hypothetical protein JNL82_03490 [Myxococcales bacterium]|nr:hypothetical protein [Myxococcales bacterium]
MAPPVAVLDLTLPREGSGTVRDLLSRGLRRLLTDLGRLDVRGASPAARAAYAGLLAAVREAMAAAPGAVWSALRRPTVGALIRVARFPGRTAAVLDELVATLAVELALAGALGSPLRVPAPPRIVGLGARTSWRLPTGALVCGAGVVHEGEQGTRALAEFEADPHDRPVVIADGLVLAPIDNNPLAHVEAHPDKQGNAVDLGGRAPEAWAAALREALALVERWLPGIRAEMAVVLQQVVPVGYDAERHLSASYQEAIGTVYLSLHPDPMTLAEALVHEFQHNKINLLLELDAVLENAYSPLYASPVRPDPRPLHGVLLAVHAFLPVARMYMEMLAAGDPRAADPRFRQRYAAIVAGNRQGVEVLRAHARPTNLGAGVLAEIDALERGFAGVA